MFVRPAELLPVQADRGEGVEPVEREQDLLAAEEGSGHVELPPVTPSRLGNPLQAVLVVPKNGSS